MKKAFLLFVLVILQQCGWGQVMWQKTIGIPNCDVSGYSIIESVDKGYCLCGTTSYGSGVRLYVVKLDSNLNIQWSKALWSSNNDYATSMVQDEDGGYSICGYNSSNSSSSEALYIKLDYSGNFITQKYFQDIPNHFSAASSIIQTTNGEHILCGYSSIGVNIIKLNLNADIEWSEQFIYDGQGESIIQTSDGGYAIAGLTGYGPGGDAACVIKLDSNGFALWAKSIGDSLYQNAHSIVQTSDGGYALCGEIVISNIGCLNVSKLDSSGNLLWTKSYCRTAKNWGSKILELSNGDLVVSGKSASSFASDFILRLDSVGNIIWSNDISASASNSNSLIKTSDGGFILCASLFDGNYTKVLLVKLDANGNTCDFSQPPWTVSSLGQIDTIPRNIWGMDTLYSIAFTTTSTPAVVSDICNTVNINELFAESKITIYPNPAHTQFTISLNEESGRRDLELGIYDVTGREVYQNEVRNSKFEISGVDFAPGVYFVKVGDGVQKLVIE